MSRKERKAKSRYQDFLHFDGGCTFAEYLGISKPYFEIDIWKHRGAPIRMKGPKVCGDWCKTKQDAKASYKQALRL